MHLRRTIGNIVVIFIRVKEQVGGIHHPHAAAPRQCAGRDVQASDEIFMRLIESIAIFVFKNRDLVRALDMVWGRLRHFVEHRPQMLVVLEDFQSGRKGILEVLHYPHPPALIETDADWLTHVRLARGEVYVTGVRQGELFERFLRRDWFYVWFGDLSAALGLPNMFADLFVRGAI